MSESYNIETAKCPSCGEPMQTGYIAGQWYPLRWTESPDPKTIFAGEPLHQKSVFSTTTFRAARCTRCGVGAFTFSQ